MTPAELQECLATLAPDEKTDRIVCLGPEEYCVWVAGRLIGSWPCRQYAAAGLAVEQRRASQKARKKMEVAQ